MQIKLHCSYNEWSVIKIFVCLLERCFGHLHAGVNWRETVSDLIKPAAFFSLTSQTSSLSQIWTFCLELFRMNILFLRTVTSHKVLLRWVSICGEVVYIASCCLWSMTPQESGSTTCSSTVPSSASVHKAKRVPQWQWRWIYSEFFFLITFCLFHFASYCLR